MDKDSAQRPGSSPHAIGGAELKEAALTGARLSAFAQVAIEIFGFAGGVVLARLIAPAEFGLVAVALIVPPIALALSLQGIATPLVQRSELRHAHVQVATLMSLVLGLSLSAATLVLAPVIAGPLFGDETARFLQLASPAFALAALRTVPFALLQRQLDFRRLTLVEVASRLTGSVAAVVLAVAGMDGEAVVIGALAAAAVSALLFVLSAPLALPRWHRREAGELLAFGGPAALASLTYNATRQADYAILAAKLSSAQVGFYWRAYQLGVEYQSKLTSVMLRVAFPILSRAREADELRRVRLRITRLHSAVILPLLAFFIIAAPTLVPWVYGPAWEPAVLPAQILAVAGMAVALTSGTGAVVLALGKPNSLLVWNTATLVLLVSVVTWTASYGLTAACIGVVGTNLTSLAGAYYFLLHRQVGIPLTALVTEVLPGVVLSGTILAFGLAVSPLELPPVPLLALMAAGSGVLYLGLLRHAFPAAWGDLSMLGGRLVSRSRAAQHPQAARPAPAEASAR